MSQIRLDAPFPWFGGKRLVAAEVWRALGPVENYVEPFAGSLAVLLGRPDDRWRTGSETVNDADAYLCNFWRAIKAAPDEVARHADWPVNEADLLARHIWLVNTGRERIARLEGDPEYYDAKVAGWWVWGICAWIGSGWCAGVGPWTSREGMLVYEGRGGSGVWRQRPHLGDAGQGVHSRRPHLGDAGRGVNRAEPSLGEEEPGLLGWFNALADRLRRVRVCCGDWSRVVTDGALSHGSVVGVFLDPPYAGDVRSRDLYRVEGYELSTHVREWALSHGDDPRFRIVLAGYEDEHRDAMPSSWRVIKWKARRAYGRRALVGVNTGNEANRHKERLWLSPHCQKLDMLEEASLLGEE